MREWEDEEGGKQMKKEAARAGRKISRNREKRCVH